MAVYSKKQKQAAVGTLKLIMIPFIILFAPIWFMMWFCNINTRFFKR